MNPTTTTRVYLVRHGRTALNADGRLRGLSDPPLDDVGVAEVARLAAALADVGPQAVVTSPLQRAVVTGRAIASAAGIEAVIDDRLNDRDYGPFTGARRTEVEAEYGSVDAAPGVEPLAALSKRARAGFDELVAESRGDPLVLVSHDALIQALIADLDPALAGVEQRTACWNLLTLSGTQWRVEAYNQKPG